MASTQGVGIDSRPVLHLACGFPSQSMVLIANGLRQPNRVGWPILGMVVQVPVFWARNDDVKLCQTVSNGVGTRRGKDIAGQRKNLGVGCIDES